MRHREKEELEQTAEAQSDQPAERQAQEEAEELRRRGYGVIPPQQYLIDIEPEFFPLWDQVRPYTMIGIERAYALYKAVEYLQRRDLPGALVECGVWQGGASMLMALSVKAFGGRLREIYLYDTFAGMTEPGEEDVIAWNGVPVRRKWEEDRRGEKQNFTHWAVSRERVLENFRRVDYPAELLHAVQGDVAQTLREAPPEEIALLRLDTDWYASTLTELELLYPRLQRGGVLLVDDYGHFTGARKAVDRYFAERPIFLHRDDYTGRSAVKPE
jgi:hypothetical protein